MADRSAAGCGPLSPAPGGAADPGQARAAPPPPPPSPSPSDPTRIHTELAGPAGADPAGPVALFGTSADPPTQGHRALLLGLRRLYPLVATWASDNPMKQHTAPLELRQRLLAAVVAAIADPAVQVVPELSSPWAVETLERARRRWPQRPLVFVIGSDLVPQLPRWREAERVLAGCRLGVAPRRGWPLQASDLDSLRQLGADLELLPLQIPASASSALRAAAAAPADRQQLPAELWPLLLQHNPYGLPPP